MFDTYSPTQKVNTNAVSGTLSKTCKDSYVIFEVITPEDFKKLYV